MLIKQQLNKKTITIGEKLKYTLSVSADKGIEIELPKFVQSLGDFKILDSGQKKSAFFRKNKFVAWCLLETYSVGIAAIPVNSIKYRKNNELQWSEIKTSEQSVEVKSLLKDAAEGQNIKDIKGPLALKSKSRPYILGIILLIILIISALFIYKKKPLPALVVPPRPAHEIAYEQLEELRAKGLVAKGRIKEYFIEISAIVRRYLENRFNLRAPEMTTEEFLVYVRDYARLEGAHKSLLREFLTCCDLVKFAKYAPSAEEIDSVFATSKKFVGQTKEIQQGTISA
ncbi:MAG: hypothetical protein WC628_05060 [Candidatus Omnitrophota bacterium]